MVNKLSSPDQSLALSCAAVIVAAGSGTRALPGNDSTLAKQFWKLGSKMVLAHSLDYFTSHPRIVTVILVLPNSQINCMNNLIASAPKPVQLVSGGATRQDSVLAGLNALAAMPDCESIVHVAIHDAARPFIPANLLDRLISAVETAQDYKTVGAIPTLPLTDSIKTLDKGDVDNSKLINASLNRSQMTAAQTPQLFNRKTITSLHKKFINRQDFTDDCSLAEAAGFHILAIDGAKSLMKLTDAEDFAMLEQWLAQTTTKDLSVTAPETNHMTETRHGIGFDVHKFDHKPGPIWLGGIKFDSERRMLAHSDGDVGLHALCDAIFGALADGDIGSHFPPSDPQWKNADSADFLAFAIRRVAKHGGSVIHLDLTFICEFPKIGPHRDAMRSRISEICELSIDRVSVKATTSEGLGFTGRGEGIAAQASATITLPVMPDTSQQPNHNSQK